MQKSDPFGIAVFQNGKYLLGGGTPLQLYFVLYKLAAEVIIVSAVMPPGFGLPGKFREAGKVAVKRYPLPVGCYRCRLMMVLPALAAPMVAAAVFARRREAGKPA